MEETTKLMSLIAPVVSEGLRKFAQKAEKEKKETIDRIVSQWQFALNEKGLELQDAKAALEKCRNEYVAFQLEANKDKEELAKARKELCQAFNETKALKQEIEALKANTPVSFPCSPKQPREDKRIRHFVCDKVTAALKAGVNVFLYGPAGTGKNVIAEMVAKDLGVQFQTSARLEDEFGIKGFVDGHGKYHETPFYKAFTQGGVFFFDEVDASNEQAMIALNAALANRYFVFDEVGLVQAHPDFYVIAGGNTCGTGADENYNGRNKLDASTLDRFIFFEVDYDERIENAMSGNDTELVSFIHDLRNTMTAEYAKTTVISYRCIANIVALKNSNCFKLDEILQASILKGMDKDNAMILANNLKNPENKYAKAFRTAAKKIK